MDSLPNELNNNQEIQSKVVISAEAIKSTTKQSSNRMFAVVISSVLGCLFLLICGYYVLKYVEAKKYKDQGEMFLSTENYQAAKDAFINSLKLWNNNEITNKLADIDTKIQNYSLVPSPVLNTQTINNTITPTQYIVRLSPTLKPNTNYLSPTLKLSISQTLQPSLTIALSITQKTNNVYSISYFDIEKATNKALAEKSEIDSGKITSIENVLNYMQIKLSFINNIPIVFLKNYDYGSQPLGIYWKNSQLIISDIEQDEKGAATAKYIILDNTMTGGKLEAVFTHELDHVVGFLLSADEFKIFMQKRGMPNDVIESWYTFIKNGNQGPMPSRTTTWNSSPKEDFAEVFKSIYGTKTVGGEWNVKTDYGNVTNDQSQWFKQNISPKFQ